MNQRQSPGEGKAALSRGERRDGLFLTLLAAMLVIVALVNSFSVADEWRRRGAPLAFVEPLIWETSSIIVLMSVAPLFMAFFRRVWPLDPRWWRTLAFYAPAMLVYSLIHIVGMGVLRWAA